MNSQDKLLETCKRTIETRLGWGSSELWTNQDYEKLSLRILDATGVHLSAATLKRIWGKIRYESKPAVTTLDTLAKFAGHESWRQFGLHVLGAHTVAYEHPVTEGPADSRFFAKSFIIVTVSLLTISALALFFVKSKKTFLSEKQDPSLFAFSSKKVVSEGVPNTVIFDYDASKANPDDTIVVQQSWDPRLRTIVSKDERQHTSIYYHPGFFKAKLIINNEIVKEHDLFIKTHGWLGMVDVKPVPVYLKKDDISGNGILTFSIDALRKTGVALQPMPPWTCFYYVNDFKDLKSDSVIFEASIRNDYSEGAAACQHTEVHLLFEGFALVVPLSAKGCVSELKFLDMDGKKKDLSALGVDFTNWVNIRAEMQKNIGRIFIDGKSAFEFNVPMAPAPVVGMQFRFQGTGSVDSVKLSRPGGDVVFVEEF